MAGTRSSLKGGGRDSQASIQKDEAPVRLDQGEDVDRPTNEGMAKKEIEYSIEKKRARVTMDAKHKAEKAKQE